MYAAYAKTQTQNQNLLWKRLTTYEPRTQTFIKAADVEGYTPHSSNVLRLAGQSCRLLMQQMPAQGDCPALNKPGKAAAEMLIMELSIGTFLSFLSLHLARISLS